MENEYPTINCAKTVLLCGTGDDVQLIGQTLRDYSVPVEVFGDLQLAVEAAARLTKCVLVAERNFVTGPDASKLRLRLNAMPAAFIVAIGAEASYKEVSDLVRTGIAGFIQPTFTGELLERIFDRVVNGELWVSRRLLSGMVSNQPSNSASLLTRRELEVVRRMAAGCNNRQIAEALFVTRDTVRWHLRSAYAKLGVHDRHAVSELLWIGADADHGHLPESGHLHKNHFHEEPVHAPA